MNVGFLAADPLSPVPGINFETGFNSGPTSVLRRADGSRIIGGSFSTLEGLNRRGLAALRPDGSVDTAFNENLPFDPNYGSNVSGVIELNDGSLLVWGTLYLSGQGTMRHYLVRLNANGSLNRVLFDQNNASSYIYSATQLDNGTILIGGGFRTLNGVDAVARRRIRWRRSTPVVRSIYRSCAIRCRIRSIRLILRNPAWSLVPGMRRRFPRRRFI